MQTPHAHMFLNPLLLLSSHTDPSPPSAPFAPARSFLALSCAAVHHSCHQPRAALALLDALGPCLTRLPPHHPNVTLVLSCRGYALHAAGQLLDAYEQLVQVGSVEGRSLG